MFLIEGYVTHVTTMNLSDDLVQSECEIMSHGQCAESGELNEYLKSWQLEFKLYERQRSEGRHFVHGHPKDFKSCMRTSSRNGQPKIG